MITTCTTCGKCYEAGSEEQANEPTRYCPGCWAKLKNVCKHSLDISPSGQMASCTLCGFVGRWRDGVWEKVEESAPVPPAAAKPHTPGPWYAYSPLSAGVHAGHHYRVANSRPRGIIQDEDGSWVPDFPDWLPTSRIICTTTDDALSRPNALLIAAAPDMLQMLRDIDAHFAAHFGEQAWATSEIGGMTRVTIAKAAGGSP